MHDLVLKNCNVVNENVVSEVDIGINNERIEKIAANISSEARNEIDLQGKLLIPGLIDDQVHFREPGLTHKGEIATESKAAIAGGVTSYFEMPNVNPNTSTIENLEKKFDIAANKSYANYSFYLGATNDNIEEIKKSDPNASCGLKVFMGASTGDLLVDKYESLEKIFEHCPTNIVTHCEDPKRLVENENIFQEKYGDQLHAAHHAVIRDEECCYLSSSLAVGLAKRFGANLHVLHLSTKREMDLFEPGPIDNKKITAEGCVHHLTFSDKDYEELGNFIVCNPSIKTEEDRLGLIDAVTANKIDIFATDHAPHTFEEKSGKYPKIPAGIPLVQHSLQMLLEFYFDGIFSLEMIVEKSSHNVAKRFNIKDRGYIREGYFADLTCVDLDKHYTVKKDNILFKCGWSPLENRTLRSSIYATILNGNIAFKDGVFAKSPLFGKRLEFNY